MQRALPVLIVGLLVIFAGYQLMHRSHVLRSHVPVAVAPARVVIPTVTKGLAWVRIEHAQSLLIFSLEFRDPDGMNAPPVMRKAPTFAVVNAVGKAVYRGAFEFG